MTTKTRKQTTPEAIPSLISNSKLQKMYTTMLQCRIVDAHARKLDNKSISSRGKEAAIIGATIDLLPDDRVVTAWGSASIGFAKGKSLDEIFSNLQDRAAGRKNSKRISRGPLDLATQSGIAAGLLLSDRKRNPSAITVAFLQSGAGPVGSWQAAFQFASSQKLPLLGVCDASALEAGQLSSAEFPIIPVDGSDVVAVYRVAFESITRIRQSGGPCMIVCQSIPSEIDSTRPSDPVRFMEQYLTRKNLFTPDLRKKTIDRFEKTVAQAVSRSRKKRPAVTKASVLEDVILL